MIYLFLGGLAMCLVTVCFNYGYELSGIHTAYLGLYKGLLEEAVVVAESSGDPYAIPRFYLPRVNLLTTEYLDNALLPYCKGYSLACRGYSKGKYLSSATYCTKVWISFLAETRIGKSVYKEAYFHIERSETWNK